MEELGNSLFLDDVPESWTRRAYPSMSGLAAWFVDLLLRIKELESWTSDFCLPNVVWLSGFFNPQSFLTAIEQSMARKNEWPLDKMALQVNALRLQPPLIVPGRFGVSRERAKNQNPKPPILFVTYSAYDILFPLRLTENLFFGL